MLALKFFKKEKDPNKREDFEKIAESLVKHPKIDLNRKKNGKTASEMFKSKKIIDIFTRVIHCVKIVGFFSIFQILFFYSF